MRILLPFLLLYTFSLAGQSGRCLAQDAPEKQVEIFGNIEQMPQLLLKTTNSLNPAQHKRASQLLLVQFIQRHLSYPKITRYSCGPIGTVVVRFTITSEGRIDAESIQCVRDIGPGYGEEAVRVIQLMEQLDWRWVPGKQLGKPVPVQYHIPINFH